MKDFFEKAQEVATKTLNTAKEQLSKAGSAVDVKKEELKLKWTIASKEAALDKLFASYGKALYYNSDAEKIHLIYETIATCIAEIDEMKEELDEMSANIPNSDIVYCNKCGSEESMEDDFCHKCGNELKK